MVLVVKKDNVHCQERQIIYNETATYKYTIKTIHSEF